MNTEKLTTDIFGTSFSAYTKKQDISNFIAPFYTRFEKNNLPLSIFKGKVCLDAGCGSGRGSLFMLENGAEHVTGIDLSDKNVATSKNNTMMFGYDNCAFRKESVLDIPFPDQTFDIVWSNGVLHHTTNPTKALNEISRVLKVDGWMWLYLYGKGGIDWYTREVLFRELQDIDYEDCICIMRESGLPINHISEFMDACKVPIVENYSEGNLTAKLKELGFDNPSVLKYGTDYDTNVLRERLGRDLMGDGDLRYFCKKIEHVTESPTKLIDLSKHDSKKDRVLFCNRIYRAMRYNPEGKP